MSYICICDGVCFQQTVDFPLTAMSMGFRGVDLGTSPAPFKALKAALTEPGPCVINLPISETEMVFPMVAPGGANRDMIHGENV